MKQQEEKSQDASFLLDCLRSPCQSEAHWALKKLLELEKDAFRDEDLERLAHCGIPQFENFAVLFQEKK